MPPTERRSAAAAAAARTRIAVHYPCRSGRIVLRTELDWSRDVVADHVSADGSVHEFHVAVPGSHLYFKPMLRRGDELRWARGSNYLVVRHRHRERQIWPHFEPDDRCTVCELRELVDERSGTTWRYRVFHPPGYAENTLARYPVLYLQDGQNVFFGTGDRVAPAADWRIDETLLQLAGMNAVHELIAVGVYPEDRTRDYTLPGSERYARFLAEGLKPHIDREFRTRPEPEHTGVMGASLGGVAAFYTAWQWPSAFGKAACLSTTFGWRDDLADRVRREGKRPVTFYLDSGWPHDNYEATRDMRALLADRGWREGEDLHYLAFPEAHHHERSWALRCHIPIQILFGRGPGRS